MYRKRVIHPFNVEPTPLPVDEVATLWSLFVAIGDHWTLGDDPERYRLRFVTFMENRIDVEPIYRQTYRDGAKLIDRMVADLGAAAAFRAIFTDRPEAPRAGVPSTPLEVLQRFVADEFITLRLALGSFKTFGAMNYRGYFGGTNVEGQPIPYRSNDHR